MGSKLGEHDAIFGPEIKAILALAQSCRAIDLQ